LLSLNQRCTSKYNLGKKQIKKGGKMIPERIFFESLKVIKRQEKLIFNLMLVTLNRGSVEERLLAIKVLFENLYRPVVSGSLRDIIRERSREVLRIVAEKDKSEEVRNEAKRMGKLNIG